MLDQKKIVTWALLILFFALSVVYSLAYMRKTVVFKPSTSVPPVVQADGVSDTVSSGEEEQVVQKDEIIQVDIDTTPIISVQPDIDSQQQPTIQLLPGTTTYVGALDIIDILGVNPNYILQDDRGNYFASYGTRGLGNFTKTVQNLGGNVYVMATETEILKNELFGDKVSYINIDAFKDKIVLMVIDIDGEIRLIQVPSSRYHASKAYFKGLFVN